MFRLHRKGSSATEAVEYIVAGATIGLGTLLKYDNGKLVIASGSEVPEYVSLGTAKLNEICPVKRILEDEVYETTLSADGASLKLGQKVTVDVGGDKVTATVASGIFEIVEMLGTGVGSKVRGLFRR